MPYEYAVNPSAPIAPTEEEDWGEDWGDVTAAVPDINEELEMYFTELLVCDTPEDRYTRS